MNLNPDPLEQHRTVVDRKFSSNTDKRPAITRVPTESQRENLESQAQIRERLLLTQVDSLQDEIAKLRKIAVMCDQAVAERDALHAQNEDLRHQVAELSKTIDNFEEARKTADRKSSEIEHLLFENAELHQENRMNGARLADFSKRVESLSLEVSRLKDDRQSVTELVVKSRLDPDVKSKILDLTRVGEVERSKFRKRFLDSLVE